MDVTMPDGTVIEGVPEGTTKAQLAAKYSAHLGGVKSEPGPQPSAIDRTVGSPLGRLAHDAVVAPVQTLLASPLNSGALLNHYLTGSKMPSGPMDQNALGLEAPYQGALARNRNTPGYAKARAEADAVHAPHPSALGLSVNGSGLTDQLTAPFNPAIAGALGAPGGFDAMNANADAQAAAQDAYAKKHPLLATGAGIMGGFLMAPKLSAPKVPAEVTPYVPTVADLKSGARDLYKQVDDSGVRVSTDALNDMADRLQDKLSSRLDPTLHPDATAAFNRVMRYATDAKDVPGPATFSELDNLRKVVSDAAASVKPADRELAKQIRNHIDDFMDNLSASHLDTSLVDAARADLTAATGAKGQLAKQIKAIEQNKPGALAARGAAGAKTREQYMALRDQLPQAEAQRTAALQNFQNENALIEAGPESTVKALNAARDLWGRARQSEIIQKVLDRAEITASGYTQSGKENAIRAGFRQLALNEAKMARLSPDVRALVVDVAKGGPVTNTLRNIGRFAPHGPVAAAAGASLGSGLGALAGGVAGAAGGGGVGAALLPLVGEGARHLATVRTAAAAQEALKAAALGKGFVRKAPQPLLSAPRRASQLPIGLPPLLLASPQRQ